jgi:adenine-specific DNA-methyltransferase
LDGDARFEPGEPRFHYAGPLARHGSYHFDWKRAEQNGDIFYRQDHPLAARVIADALGRKLPVATVTFDYSGHGGVISVLRPLVGSAGWLELSKLTVETFESEEFLIFAARSDAGAPLDEDTCRKLFLLPARTDASQPDPPPDLAPLREREVGARLKEVEDRNGRFFDEEVLKLDRWSDDLKQGLERELKELDRQIREARKTAALAASLRDKLDAQKTLKALEATRTSKRRELFDAQDAIDRQRDELIGRIEQQLRRRQTLAPLFQVRWSVS